MTKVLPPKGFAGASLQIHDVPAGQRFGRISLGRYPDPLGYGKTPSRFSDPRRRVAANRFGVLYLGESVKVCFLEAVLRDQRDGAIGDLPMAEAELHHHCYAEIEIAKPSRKARMSPAWREIVTKHRTYVLPAGRCHVNGLASVGA